MKNKDKDEEYTKSMWTNFYLVNLHAQHSTTCTDSAYTLTLSPMDSMGVNLGTIVTSPWYFCFTTPLIDCPKKVGKSPNLASLNKPIVHENVIDGIRGAYLS